MSLIRHSLSSGETLHLWLKAKADAPASGVVVRCNGADIASLEARVSADPLRQVVAAPRSGTYEIAWDPEAVLVSLAYCFDPAKGLEAAVTPLWTTPDNRVPADGPAYHFAPPWGWMNDPNGVCRVDGWFHLFYQHMPHRRRRYRTIMYWGHAVSRDGLTWTHLPIFLAPREELLLDGGSAGGAYSGSAIADGEGGLRIFYTDREDARLPEREWQLTFRTRDGLAPAEEASVVVAARPDIPGIKNDFRDPFVFRGPDGLWKMVLGSRSEEGGTVLLYKTEAEDAASGWRFVGEIASFAEHGLGAAECPCLLPLGDTGLWALSVSLICHHRPTRRRNLSLLLTGRFDGRTFEVLDEGELDHGPDCYAFQGNVADGETFGIGWAANWSEITREEDCLTTMTLPRRLEWRGDHVATPPLVEAEALRGPALGRFSNVETIALPEGLAEIVLELAPEGDVSIHFDGDLAFTVTDAAMSLDFDPGENAPIHRVDARPARLRIFVDAGIVEIYADDGRWCFTKRLDGWARVGSLRVTGREHLRSGEVFGLRRPTSVLSR